MAKAKEEGQVVWYSGSSEAPAAAIAEAFEEKYGIPVSVTRLTSADIGTRFQSEASAGNVQVDVLSTVDPTLFVNLHENGLTTALTPDLIPSVANYDAEFILDDNAAVVIGIGPTAVAWNTEILPNFNPSSWEDLIDPALANEIVLVDPRSSNAWAQLWSVVLNEPSLGEDFISRFAAQGVRQVVDSSVPGAQLLAAGEAGFLMATTVNTQIPLVEQGAPLKDMILQNPAPNYKQFIALAKEAPHSNAGALFIDFLLSEEGQQIYNSVHVQASPLGNLEGTLPLPEGLADAPAARVQADLPKVLELLGIQ